MAVGLTMEVVELECHSYGKKIHVQEKFIREIRKFMTKNCV